MPKILHTADMHLDSPFTLLDASMSKARRSDLRSAFTSMMMYIKENDIDLVLIAGDMFEHDYVTKDTVSLIIREFSKLDKCKFVIAPGNHDPYTPSSVYKKSKFPDNVFIFKTPELSRISFDDIGVDVYGYAFTSSYLERNPIIGKTPVDPNKINILVAHADTTSPISKYCPITESDIEESGFDYIALGHIHTGKELTKAGNTYYAYCGCLEGRDYSECGHKGALVGNFIKDEHGFRPEISPIRFSKRRYAQESIDVTGADSVSEIANAISSVMIKRGYGDDTLLRVTITGNVSPELSVSQESVRLLLRPLYSFELIDKTLPLFDADKLAGDPTIKGAFFEALLPMLKSADPNERETASAALRYGLGAIDGSDITDF